MGLPNELRAVVTGAGSGLGRALTMEIVRRGGRVIAADIDLDGATETSRRAGRPGLAVPLRCDVARPDQVSALAEAADSELGGADLLVNNAGVAVSGPFEEIPLEDWQWIVDINLWGVIHGCRTFYPRFKAQGRGWILNVASAAGLLAPPQMSPYNVTKSAVVGLSETLAAEGRQCGVVVTALCPTFFHTNVIQSGRGGDPKLKAQAEQAMHRSRVQAPDVARAALDALGRGDTYALPMRDGRMLWRLKRFSPRLFPELLNLALRARGLQRRRGASD